MKRVDFRVEDQLYELLDIVAQDFGMSIPRVCYLIVYQDLIKMTGWPGKLGVLLRTQLTEGRGGGVTFEGEDDASS